LDNAKLSKILCRVSFISVKVVLWALAKNGSFGFAKVRLVCRAKPNVPFVRLAKIVFKKCGAEKNKKHWVG
jgi:hypothetical protein